MMKITKSTYKTLESIILENEQLHVEIVPGAGARTNSIYYKPKQTELLWQNQNPVHTPVKYAQPFPDGEGAGFDEMFPTISECYYPDFPWRGADLPDHGEVWALPWSCRIEPDYISLDVYGVRLPYRFSKRLWLEDSILKAVYTAENLSPFPMPFLYAAHPLFNVTAGDRIIVPDNLRSIINAEPSDVLPEYGKSHEWTETLAVMPPKNSSGYKKYYFAEKNTTGWSILRRAALGFDIKMSASADKLPYLGIWMNEGGWAGQYNLALEPASASMDGPVAARMWRCESILGPNEVRTWEIECSVIERIRVV